MAGVATLYAAPGATTATFTGVAMISSISVETNAATEVVVSMGGVDRYHINTVEVAATGTVAAANVHFDNMLTVNPGNIVVLTVPGGTIDHASMSFIPSGSNTSVTGGEIDV